MQVYNRMGVILKNPAYCERLFTIIKAQLPTDGKDMQISAAEGFISSLKQTNLKLPVDVLLDIFNLCLLILGQWNMEVIDEWIKIFSLVVSQLDWNFMKDKLADLINGLSLSSQPKQSRYAAARLISAIAQVSPSSYQNKGKFMEGPIFSRAIHLCQDCEKDVRLVMASEAILPIYAAIETDVCRNILLEKVLELIYDPNLEVKAHTIRMLIDLLDYIHKSDTRDKIVSIVIELLQIQKEEVVLAISSKFSQLLTKVYCFDQ